MAAKKFTWFRILGIFIIAGTAGYIGASRWFETHGDMPVFLTQIPLVQAADRTSGDAPVETRESPANEIEHPPIHIHNESQLLHHNENAPIETPPVANLSVANPPAAVNSFSRFPFYIAENYPEYVAFWREYPDLTAEEVVWKVNVGLNRPFFTDAYFNLDPHPLLVNPFNVLPYDFRPRTLVPVGLSWLLATQETAYAFSRMQASAANDDIRLVAGSGFRTVTRQRELFANNGGFGNRPMTRTSPAAISINSRINIFGDVRGPSFSDIQNGIWRPLSLAPPGFSEHHTGRAIDLIGPNGQLLDGFAPSETGRWVAANSYRYGFIVRYTQENRHITGYIHEPWHITYVGVYISMAMRIRGYGSLEEFVGRYPWIDSGW